MQQANLSLTPAQAKKLIKGLTVKLRHDQLHGGANWLALHPMQIKKIENAMRRGTGVSLTLSPDEIESSGEGIRDLIKKAGKYYKEHIKPVVGPIIKKGISKLVDMGTSAFEAAVPESIPVVEAAKGAYKNKIIEKIGRVTGAYGLPRGGEYGLRDDSGHFLSPMHPAMNPAFDRGSGEFPYSTVLRVWCPHCSNEFPTDTVITGGSFRPVGRHN